MHDRTDQQCVLLAGGASRRMGRDKRWLEIDGQSLLRRAACVLEPLAPRRIVCCDAAAAASIRRVLPGWEVRVDRVPYAGPLRALAGIDSRRDTFVLAIDLPGLQSQTLAALPGRASEASLVVVPRAGGRLQPLAAWYRSAGLHRLQQAAAAGATGLTAVLLGWPPQCLTIVDAATFGRAPEAWDTEFENLNTSEDWQRWRDNYCSSD